MSDFTTPSGDTLNEIKYNNVGKVDFSAPAVKVDGVKIYYSSSGVVQVRDSSNTDVVLWQNGHWTDRGKELVPPATRIAIRKDINVSTVEAFKTAGGNANGYVLPSFIIDNSQGVNNTLTDQELANLGVIVPNVSSQNNTETEDKLNLGEINKEIQKAFSNVTSVTEFSTVTENLIRKLSPIQYPIDAQYDTYNASGLSQDYVRITQFTYKPPRADTFFRKSGFGVGDVVDIMTSGIRRNSPLKKYLGLVKLPMPTNVSDSNNVNWGADNMNNLSAAMTAGVMNNMMGAGIGAAAGNAALGPGGAVLGMLAGMGIQAGEITKDNWAQTPGKVWDKTKEVFASDAGALLGSTITSKILAAGGMNISPESILARGWGVIPNSNMELLFQSPTLRSFSFDWKMTPRDEDEAMKIRNIIRFFKQGMAARKMKDAAGEASLYLGTPNVFHVQYKSNSNYNMEGVNRIKTCACTGCAVNYTPDGIWSAYEDGQPVSTIMSLRMQELEPVYDTDYNTDIVAGRTFNDRNPSNVTGDLYPIGQNEVGY